jgi:hypothetical protein
LDTPCLSTAVSSHNKLLIGVYIYRIVMMDKQFHYMNRVYVKRTRDYEQVFSMVLINRLRAY